MAIYNREDFMTALPQIEAEIASFRAQMKKELKELDDKIEQFSSGVADVLVNGTSVVTNSIANVTVPTKVSQLTNDSGFIATETDPTVPSWAKASSKPSYNFSEIGSKPTTLSGYGITDAKIASGTITLGSDTITPLTSFTETDPTVPAWAKASSKPSYTASEVGAVPTSRTVNNKALSSDITLSASDVSALPISGGTMTGQIKTSFKESVATGSYQATATTIPDLVNEVRMSSGCMGSFCLGTAYTKDGITVAANNQWYNFLYVPHRSGGVNGTDSQDNTKYGTLVLWGMSIDTGMYCIRVASSGGTATIMHLQLYQPATQKSLWSGVSVLDGNTTLNLSANISAQSTGVVLIWSKRNADTNAGLNQNLYYQYIPKWHVANMSGVGIEVPVSVSYSHMAYKYIYVTDSTIRGHSVNTANQSVGSIPWQNNLWALREVIGV